MERATQERRAEMYGLIEAWESSGQGQKAFCQEQDISYSVFKYWLRKHRGIGSPKQKSISVPTGKFRPLGLKEGSSIPVLEVAYPNGVSVKCPSGIEIDQLRELVKLF